MKQNILIFLLIGLINYGSFSQSRWLMHYMDAFNAPVKDLKISYDNGYLLSGWISPNLPHYSWLIKTDINGEVLWQKLIGGANNSTLAIEEICLNSVGEIFLCGGTMSGNDANPMLIKLNACGEKEWCTEFSTTSDNDFFWDVVCTPDGGCAVLVYGAFIPLFTYRAGILKFSAGGDLLWQQYYQSPDQSVSGVTLSDLNLAPDEGFLLSGFCYYLDPENPDLAWLHPYYIKADSLGYFEWETIVHKETGDIGGQAFMSLVNPSGTNFYSCISHYYHSDTLYTTRPAIVKLDLQGNVMGVYDLVHGLYDLGKIMTFDFLNDSVLTGSASWRNEEDEPQSRVVVLDTLGNITNSVTILNDYFLGFTKTTFDDKILILISDHTSGEFDPTLFKLTQDLEQDTFYTTPFIYDSLCPYQIASDTIVPDDCGLIVGIEEDDKTVGRYDGKKGGIELFPNPASELLHVRLNMDGGRFNKDLRLEIYDIFGRKVQEIKVLEKQNEVQINVEGYPPGIYLAVLKDESQYVCSGKFVVAR
ncbi:MAG: T9SS type A sorting domain-containing protein [Bacteroidales bacterium]|nr:T9SS type A sorting domain-containing protein [Bacteroidales bacterium]